jgi:hypothetical protein
MTLCIGALCNYGNAKAVLTYDTMASTGTAQAENAFKLEKLGRRWWALIAGNISEARELAGIYRSHLSGVEETLGGDDALDQLREPAAVFHERLRNNTSRRLTGFDYQDFLPQAGLFSEDIRSAVFYAQPPNVELLFLGAIMDEQTGTERLRLFKYADGEVWSCDNFAAIGSGAPIAEATLMQRAHSELWSTDRTIYAVYEAHRLGSIAPGVGSAMRMNIGQFSPNLNGIPLSVPMNPAWETTMAEAFEKFGPRAIADDLAFPQSIFLGPV